LSFSVAESQYNQPTEKKVSAAKTDIKKDKLVYINWASIDLDYFKLINSSTILCVDKKP